MNGTLTVEEGSLYDFLDLIGRNIGALEGHPLQAVQLELGRLLRLIHTYNPIGRAQKNVAHHYDLSDTLYDLFLDKDRQYSRSEEHTSELQSLMRISYAVFCLKKKKTTNTKHTYEDIHSNETTQQK